MEGGNTGGKNAEASRLTPLKSLEALGSERAKNSCEPLFHKWDCSITGFPGGSGPCVFGGALG